ncbi:rhodanese-like domain-containing protein [bacterium]|jgi:rhodanese-related sulfurtransferase|nr:rhodanese-like domain-containing protein [bacterium]
MITACVLSVVNVSGIQTPVSADEQQAANPLADADPHTKDTLDVVLKKVKEKSAVLADIREQEEWNDGHLKHAFFLPLSELKKDNPSEQVKKALAKLDKEVPIYCHCRSGRRVLSAAPLLRKMGYDVRPLKAGFDQLRKSGFEVAGK